MMKRATIYLDPKLHKIIKIKAAEMNSTVSDIVGEALRFSFKEDALDLEAIRKRAKEPTQSYEEVLKELKRDGIV